MQCIYNCGTEVEKIFMENKFKYEMLDANGTVHNCKQRQENRDRWKELKLTEAAEVTRDIEKKERERLKKLREPIYYYIKPISELSSLQYIDVEKKQGVIKHLCKCDDLDIFPIKKHTSVYYFETDMLEGQFDKYWCGYCGLPLSWITISKCFSQIEV